MDLLLFRYEGCLCSCAINTSSTTYPAHVHEQFRRAGTDPLCAPDSSLLNYFRNLSANSAQSPTAQHGSATMVKILFT